MATFAEGRCAMKGSCGSKGWFGKPLPCPYDGPPEQPDDETRSLLVSVCGSDFADGPTCCDDSQLEILRDNLNQAEPILSSCPACRNNFRSFFCHFTCTPNQASFVNVTSTQTSSTGKTAVASLDFFVGEEHGTGFFDSCKNVQMGAANTYAMDLIGGGAKDYHGFFSFLGEEKDLGSPFQINFPTTAPPDINPYNPPARNCWDNDLLSRCTCIDCPQICPELAPIPAPGSGPSCHVGSVTCLSFVLILMYSACVFAFFFGFSIQAVLRRKKEKKYDQVLSAETSSDTPLSPRTHTHGLIGASSLARYVDGEQSSGHTDTRSLGRGVQLLDPIETVQPRQYRLNSVLRSFFYRLGQISASSPWLVLAGMFTVVGLLNIGWKNFSVETDPVRLWVAPDSESKVQKEYFDEHFGPFYRTEQIFATAIPATVSHVEGSVEQTSTESKPPVLSWETLKFWFKVNSDIRSLTSSPNGYQLSDVCFKPAGPSGACVLQSVTAWFGDDIENTTPDDWAKRIEKCASTPVDCLPDFQQPLGPKYVLGGVPDTEHKYLNAEALVMTVVVSDSLDPEVQDKAMEWERTLREYLVRLSENAPGEVGLEISFSTGVSLEEEINKSTNTDVKIVVLSYLAMFVYISLTLGNGFANQEEEGVVSSIHNWAVNFPKFFTRSHITSSTLSIDSRNTPRFFPRLPRKLFIGSKFTLGLFGISLVILSVSTSIGLFSALGVKVTLIIAEVIPFLVLAVGVDNVFILVHELDRQNMLHGPNAAPPEQPLNYASATSPISRRSQFESHDDSVDARSVPLYLSPEERVARTLARMGPSILLSTITETFAFALGALVPMPAVRNFALYAAGSVLLNAILQVTVFISALVLDLRRVESNRVDCFPCIRLPSRIQLLEAAPTATSIGTLARLIRKYYAPFLLKPVVKGVVLAIFSGIFVASVISMQHIELGLDQRLALPSESYLVPYFNSLDAYLDVGPPVYFVTHDVDVTHREGQRNLCGRFTTCQDGSVANVLEAERKRPDVSFISEPTASWIDDYFAWLNPTNDACCRVRRRDPTVFCSERDSPRLCRPCFEGHEPAWNITMSGFPEGEEFMQYIQHWLDSPTTEECPLAGKASFGTALSLSPDEDNIVASHFRTFTKPLKNQADFINAFAAAHRVANDLSEQTGATVFPYSLFFVFFDQYAHIVSITQEVLGLGLASVLIMTALLLGSWRTGTIVTAVVALTVVNVMGVMGIWGISLNAISLVNLVISLGIAVEFCAHVARAFMSCGSGLPTDHPAGQKERDERMWTALVDVGPSVLSGITFTKLIGMCVLALTRSKLLEIYYFRMWLTLIISGALHGLVLLPVILSLTGGPGFPLQEADEEWMSNAIRNDYEYTPFLADDDSVHSD
ncbi:multidrug efflux transporter AcrB transmembrane domain-containing protein [Stereum hirsutum FP-91666 SS1]|uniref:multidrug efflux transporter AcrB transmembrane domain-containing protein n=1 Tax=Stereum hirsutum (strain FP-91666) TaxID=721885 RepID=UPI000440C0F6|nr:multidrug efflux transporter AcrB transmembrane domain-containing protein [Stereum hirsutum FP-91666 SS1]EIM88474.1 multidrug efflux transporter AcrB transmembrane domain-containing protein [Stereum hirsutum FP-91666 SS1]